MFNQEITDFAFLSGGLINFLCNGKKKLNIKEIVDRIVFENGTEQLKNNLLTILNEFDQQKMKKFLLFTTAKAKTPNFSIVPKYCIIVSFESSIDVARCPTASTCFNQIHKPLYPNIEIMKQKLVIAINYTEGMSLE